MKEKVSKIIYILTLAVIFIIAVTARLKGYLAVRPIWLDEALVIDNILNKNISPFSTLKYVQVMPPFFLITERIMYNVFGIKELVLRFYPFIASIIAIPLFYVFSKIFLQKKWSIIAANFLFAVNVFLIYYAQEIKQYSSDVMWFLLIFILLNKISIKDINRKNAIIYIVLSSLIPLFSTPTYFAIGAWVIRELLSCRKTKEFLSVSALQIPAVAVTAMYCSVMIKQYQDFMHYIPNFWDNGFLTNNLHFDLQILKKGINYFFTPNTNYGLEIALILIGLIILIKHFKLKENMLLFFTICFMLLFSYLKIYPLADRIMLYALPFAIILAAKSLDYISLNRKVLSIIIAFVFVFAFNGYGVKYIAKCYTDYAWYIRFTGFPINTRLLVQTLMFKYKTSDGIICNEDSSHEYNYYKKYYNFNPENEYFITTYSDSTIKSLNIKPGNYWIIYIYDFHNNNYDNYLALKSHFNFLYHRNIGHGSLLYARKK